MPCALALLHHDPAPAGPSDDQASTPIPWWRAEPMTSTSARRARSEYSTCTLLSFVRERSASCHVAAVALCQPTKFDTPT